MHFQYADSFSKFSLLLQSRLKASVLQSIPLMTLSFEATIPNCWTSHISVVFRLLPTSARLLLSCVSLNFLTTLLTPVHDTRCDTNFEYSSPALWASTILFLKSKQMYLVLTWRFLRWHVKALLKFLYCMFNSLLQTLSIAKFKYIPAQQWFVLWLNKKGVRRLITLTLVTLTVLWNNRVAVCKQKSFMFTEENQHIIKKHLEKLQFESKADVSSCCWEYVLRFLLNNKRHRHGSFRRPLRDQQQEDRLSEQHRDGQGHLLTTCTQNAQTVSTSEGNQFRLESF